MCRAEEEERGPMRLIGIDILHLYRVSKEKKKGEVQLN